MNWLMLNLVGMLINVDFDGTLVTMSHENNLFEKVKREGLSLADESSVWDWYAQLICSPLPLNTELLHLLSRLKEEGHHLRLWTNRNYELVKPTINNLGSWSRLFDSFHFYSGRKKYSQVEGVVIDNDPVNLKCGEKGGFQIPSFTL